MAGRRVRSTRRCTRRWLLLLLCSVALLLLAASALTMMTITTDPALPLPEARGARRPSRALSSADGGRGDRTGPRAGPPGPPAAAAPEGRPGPLLPLHLPPLPNLPSGAWSSSRGAEKGPTGGEGPAGGHGRTGASDGVGQGGGQRRNKNSSEGIAFKRSRRSGAGQRSANRRRSLPPGFTGNNTGPRGRIRRAHHATVVGPFPKTHNHTARGQTADLIPALANTPERSRQQGGRGAGDPASLLHPKISLRHAGSRAGTQGEPRADLQLNKGGRPITKLSERDNGSEQMKGATKHSLSGESDKMCEGQQAVKRPGRDLQKQHGVPKESPKGPGPAERDTAVKHRDTAGCQRDARQAFLDGDRRKIRRGPDAPWLSGDDLEKMELLAAGEVVSKARVPAHGQVLQAALHRAGLRQNGAETPTGGLDEDRTTQHALRQRASSESHGDRCRRGACALLKRPDDWYEVLAFHLDRVLGLNRSLPAVLRTFPQSDVLPYKYTSGAPRPAVWWEPDIQHLDDRDNDQNSVPLSWVQYQELLKADCGTGADLSALPCVGVRHSEWGGLALFDFLLQVNDRLDRCCCGFRPDPTESCVENLLNAKCRNDKELVLVHILVRRTDPSRMVFIDNAGRPHQPADNLNFRLVEGIEEFPEQSVSVLRSGCLEGLLLRSLYTDREFWERRGGARGLLPLVRGVEQRGRILLQHIRDRRLRLNRDL